MRYLLLPLLTVANISSTAQAETRQYNGVARATAEQAAMDLIQNCLSNPLVEAGVLTFSGVEELKFTQMPGQSGDVFAGGKCVFMPVSKLH